MTTLPAAFLARPRTVAHTIAGFLATSGVTRIYGLTGSHIKPLWEEAAHAGIRVVDVRHEVAAVHMAQADADLTGALAVATVTTGPGLTNAVTGIAAAQQGRVPLLVLSALPPQEQLGLGALEELDQAELVSSVTRLARTITHPRQVVPFLTAAFAAAVGEDGLPGPAYLDLPTDLLRRPDTWSGAAAALSGAPRTPIAVAASEESLAAAREALGRARRPVVISGRGAAAAGPALQRFLDATGALYLDTTESRGLVPTDHDAYVPAMRSRLMAEADTVITVGRRLDFSLAYGSRVAFGAMTQLIRIGSTFEQVAENRTATCPVKGDPGLVLEALVAAGAATDLDRDWRSSITAADQDRRQTWAKRAEASPYGPDGGIHPNAVIAAINAALQDRASLTIADGGDVLSFARVGLQPPARLDTGTFGCLGVGVPFAVAASIIDPATTVLALVGDGSLGFNVMELDTARRAGARPVIVVSNNAAWNIERHDHVHNYGANPGYNTSLPDCRYDLIAQGLGWHAERVTDIDRLGPALAEAIEHAPALLDVCTSREVQSPDFTGGLADLRGLHVLRGWDDAERNLRGESP